MPTKRRPAKHVPNDPQTLNKRVTSRSKPKPAYQRIKDSIVKNIHKGKWQAGEAIPTEYALAQRFKVSRMTVNRALKELSEERVLERRQGSGTFVAQQQFNHTVVEVRNIAEDIKSNKQRYRAEVLSQYQHRRHGVPPDIAAHFDQPMVDGAKSSKKLRNRNYLTDHIDEIKIIHYADDVPVQLEERWVNEALVPHFLEQDFSVVNTSDYLIDQIPLESGSYTIRAVPAPAEVAKALNMNEGEPALLLSRQTYSNGQVVTFVNMWHAGSDYQFSGTL